MPDMHAPRPEPHDEPWYLRLLKLGRRAEHPTPLDPELADAGSQADADMKRQQAWQEYFRLAADRNERYRIFGDMDYGSAAAIADLYAEEATQVDYDKRLTVWVDSADADTKKSVEQCLVNTVAEDTATSICRAFCVMGDHYRRVAYGTGTGVFGWRGVKPGDVSRVEDAIGRLVGFKETGKKFRGALKRDVSWPWDYVHFRLPGKYDETGYGTSAFDTMFLPWRQLCLAAGTLIWTTAGPVPVEQLTTNHVTYAHDPRTNVTRETPVKAVLTMGTQKLLRIRTQHRQIVVTENHGMLVRDATGNYLYKKAKDIVAAASRAEWPAYLNRDSLVLPRVLTGADVFQVALPPEEFAVSPLGAVDPPAGIMDALRALGFGDGSALKNAHAFLRGDHGMALCNYRRLLAAGIETPPVELRVVGGRKAVTFLDSGSLVYTADARFARFLGFMLGDGWLTPNGIGFALGTDEAQNEEYIRLAYDLFGVEPYLSQDAVPGVRGAAARIDSAAAKLIMQAFGFISGFDKKVVPSWVYTMSLEFRRAVVLGICHADAGWQSNGWRLSLANEALMQGVWMLAQGAGYPVSREIAEINREGKQTAYRVFIGDTPTDAPAVLEAVTHVDPAGTGETYDLTVADDMHNFVANGVVSHNTLAEDSKLTYMVRRAPDRNAVMVDVGDLDDAEAMEYVNRWRKSMRKQELIDPAAPGYKKQFNPLTPFEDLFIPTRGGDTASRIETLAGSGAADQVYDLNYFRDKFYGSGRVPKSYMGVGDQAGGDSAKATLVRQDVRFARLIMRIQRAYRSGMRSACDLDLVLKGADPDKLPKYLLQMAPISYLAELERLEVVRMRIELLEAMANLATTLNLDSKAWAVYILSEYGRLPEEIVKRVTAKAAAPAGQEGGKSEGAYPLNKEEKRLIHEAMLRSAGLRHAVSFIVEANAGETPDGQRDPTILEPLLSGSRTQIGDRGDQHKMLMEDILTFRAKETKEQVNG